MNKAIVVIDMPNSCDECPLFGSFYSDLCCKALNKRGINYPYPKDFRQDWCPLKPLPEKYAIFSKCSDPFYQYEFEHGYNQCIEEILGDQT